MDNLEYNYKKNQGLLNIDNTCYINSIVQCLSHSYVFYNFIISKEFDEDLREDINNVGLSKELRKLLVLCNTSNQTISINIAFNWIVDCLNTVMKLLILVWTLLMK